MEYWFSELQTPNVKLSIRVDRQLYSGRSEFQRIDIFDSPEFGRFLTLDGYMMLTEKDEFIYHEMITHVPMAVHPCVKKVLVIGAGDGGVIRELTRYPEIEQIDLVEIDQLVVEVCKKYLPQTACRFDDPRVHIYYEDGLKFIRRFENEYDLIIVDSTDPFGPGEGLFTREFTAAATKRSRRTASWSTSMKVPFTTRMPPPASVRTNALSNPSPSVGSFRHTSPPIPPVTGCLALPPKSTIRLKTLPKPAGICGDWAANTTPPHCTRAHFICPLMLRSF